MIETDWVATNSLAQRQKYWTLNIIEETSLCAIHILSKLNENHGVNLAVACMVVLAIVNPLRKPHLNIPSS